MLTNEVDKFRQDFFEKLIKEEKEKANKLKLAQKNCHHNYNILGAVQQNGYQERECSKCGHSAIKRIQIRDANKKGNCIIS